MDKQRNKILVSDVLPECDQSFIPKLSYVFLVRDLKLFVLSVSDYVITKNKFFQFFTKRQFHFYSLRVRPFVLIL
jgi:hypothetical protein